MRSTEEAQIADVIDDIRKQGVCSPPTSIRIKTERIREDKR